MTSQEPLPPKGTDKETLERLLASEKLTPIEMADIQRIYDEVVSGKELRIDQRQRATTLYDKYELGEEPARGGRRRGQQQNDALAAKFDAMPRPKKPPGK
jgi:hypothetical protein